MEICFPWKIMAIVFHYIFCLCECANTIVLSEISIRTHSTTTIYSTKKWSQAFCCGHSIQKSCVIRISLGINSFFALNWGGEGPEAASLITGIFNPRFFDLCLTCGRPPHVTISFSSQYQNADSWSDQEKNSSHPFSITRDTYKRDRDTQVRQACSLFEQKEPRTDPHLILRPSWRCCSVFYFKYTPTAGVTVQEHIAAIKNNICIYVRLQL